MTLPRPHRQRWQPLRAGLVDLFYYDEEEFWFRDGRLLLRGNNGTGKSKVLALTLPFLLDGELSAHRVEPDADPKKRMEWNLLLGGAHPHPERLGYTWLEFGRVGDDGRPEYRTLGCGLKAVAGKGIARHWYFVSSQRIGADLALVDATRIALTRDRLIESVGEHGRVYDRVRDYRRAVDEALFGLGEQRYSALVDLLVQLRAPQLSKRPSERALSDALTEALPPLDQAVITDVAEAFRSLEEDRDALTAMAEAHQAAESFLGHYRRYARTASRRRAALPRLAQSAYERVNGELKAAEHAHATAEQALHAAEAELGALDDAKVRLDARERVLRDDPRMNDARELEHAAKDAARRKDDAARLARDRETAAARLAERRQRAAAASQRAEASREELRIAREACADEAERALIGDQHRTRIESVLGSSPRLADLRQAAHEISERQLRAVAHVEQLRADVEEAHRSLSEARRRVEDLATEAGQLAERRHEAADAVDRRGGELVAATRRHLTDATELTIDDPAATLAELELWVETLDGPNPARAAIDLAGQAAAARIARAEAELRTRHDAARQVRDGLVEAIARLEAGEHTAPPAPHTRGVSTRDGRAGAPLWQLVDFAEQVTDSDRAGLEAALEAAGILDAWVTPDGELLAPDTDDVVLHADTERQSPSLATALTPAVDRGDPNASAVSDETVSGVLAAIGFGAGTNWVSADGRFRLGVLEGAWHKPAAEYVGRGAREAARRSRLAQLRDELDFVDLELEEIESERETVTTRRATLTAELTAVPDDTPLRKAHLVVATLTEENDRLVVRQDAAAAQLEVATAAAEAAGTALRDGAQELGLPSATAELAEVRHGLSGYRTAVAGLWPTWSNDVEARREHRETTDEVERADADLTHRAELATQAEYDAAEAAERHQMLLSTVGAAVAELQEQLAEVASELRRWKDDRRAADDRRTQAVAERGKAAGRRETLEEDLDRATAERADAADSLRRFAATGLLAVALPDLDVPEPTGSWAPDPTVRLARQVERDLADVPDDDNAWDRVQRKVTEELKALADTLARHGNTASASMREDGVVVDVVFQGRPRTVPEVTGALGEEVGERQRLLDEREREILENHLVNEVASTLQELISAAEAQVGQMNSELSDRPTSTGMRLRLQWLPVEDGPAGLAAARERLLRQTADAWSEDDRAAVGEFLQARIAEVRARDTASTWLEHLTEALDYRTWHRFAIQRHQAGQWRSATGPASGGERVLAASVPLFAAASSHYASAGNPHAPRLVMLDEAFAGVDDDSRAKCMGLLAAFDLDVVMTSEREWGCYPEVPGLSIAQLSRVEGIDAVLVTPWEWDGRELNEVTRPQMVAAAAPSNVEQDSLWA